MAANPIQSVSFNPLDPNSGNLAKALQVLQMRQEMAKALMAEGEQQDDPAQMIPGNALAPGQVIKKSPLQYASKALETALGGWQQKKILEKQTDLQQAMAMRNYNMMRGVVAGPGGGAASANPPPLPAAAYGVSDAGAEPAEMAPAAPGAKLAAVMAGRNGLPPIAATTPGQDPNPARGTLTASYAGIPTPPQEAGVDAGGNVGGMPVSGAANSRLAEAVNQMQNPGQTPPAAPQAAPAQQGGSIFGPGIDADTYAYLAATDPEAAKQYVESHQMTPGQKELDPRFHSVYEQQTALDRNKAGAGADFDVMPVTMPDGSTRMMTKAQAAQMAQGGLPQAAAAGSTPAPQPPTGAIPSPAAAPGAVTPPASGGNLPGMAVQSPAQAKGAEADATNAATYKSDLVKQVREGEQLTKMAQAQNQLLDAFKGGAWQSNRAHYAAMAQSLGASPETVQKIANGDPSAVQAFQGMQSLMTLTQLKSLLAGQRIAQSEFNGLQEDLADPDKNADATRYINNMMISQYKDNADELGSLTDWEKTGKPLSQFRQNYSAGRENTLLNGQEKSAAAPPAAKFNEGQTARNPQTGARMIFKGGAWQPIQ